MTFVDHEQVGRCVDRRERHRPHAEAGAVPQLADGRFGAGVGIDAVDDEAGFWASPCSAWEMAASRSSLDIAPTAAKPG